MLYLLTDEQKKKVLKEYRMRLGVVILITLSIVGVIGIVSIIPSKFLVSTQENILDLKLENAEKSSNINSDDLSKKMTEISNASLFLEPLNNSVIASDLFNHLEQQAGTNTSIRQFQFNHFDDSASIQISGFSKNRDSLTKFINLLKQDPMFSGATFPYNSLAKQDNLSFNLNLVINTKNEK